MPGKGAGIIVASSFSSSSCASCDALAIAATLAVGLDVFTLTVPLATVWLGCKTQTLEFGVVYSSLLSECRLSEFVLLTLSILVVFVIAVETLSNEPPYMIGLMLSNGLVLADAEVIVADRFRGLCLYLVKISVSSDLEGGSRVFCSGIK